MLFAKKYSESTNVKSIYIAELLPLTYYRKLKKGTRLRVPRTSEVQLWPCSRSYLK